MIFGTLSFPIGPWWASLLVTFGTVRSEMDYSVNLSMQSPWSTRCYSPPKWPVCTMPAVDMELNVPEFEPNLVKFIRKPIGETENTVVYRPNICVYNVLSYCYFWMHTVFHLSVLSRIRSYSYRRPVASTPCLWSDHRITDHQSWSNDTCSCHAAGVRALTA